MCPFLKLSNVESGKELFLNWVSRLTRLSFILATVFNLKITKETCAGEISIIIQYYVNEYVFSLFQSQTEFLKLLFHL